MNLSDVTPLVLTGDEEANIARTLEHLRWAERVIVVDSLSTDGTAEIAASFPNVSLVTRPLDDMAGQWNFGLSLVHTPWVLALDADHVVPAPFVKELRALEPGDGRAFVAPFVYAVGGRPLRGSLYPPREVLLSRAHCSFWQDGHTQRVRSSGGTRVLQSALIHDDRKSFARFLARQRRYMREEAVKIRGTPFRRLPISGKIRRLVVLAPFAVLVQSLLVHGLIADGRAGLRYAAERVAAELILSRELLRPAP